MSERYRDEEILRWLYWDEEQSTVDIGEIFDVWPSTIHKWMEKLGVDRRKQLKDRVPSLSKHSDGYNQFWGRDDETGKQRPVYTHRLLAVAEHGLDAIRGKEVHHKNGCEFDNRPDNIEVLSKSEHRKRHVDGELING